jgi:hypothetical protein
MSCAGDLNVKLQVYPCKFFLFTRRNFSAWIWTHHVYARNACVTIQSLPECSVIWAKSVYDLFSCRHAITVRVGTRAGRCDASSASLPPDQPNNCCTKPNCPHGRLISQYFRRDPWTLATSLFQSHISFAYEGLIPRKLKKFGLMSELSGPVFDS